jgi:hypothetical protein
MKESIVERMVDNRSFIRNRMTKINYWKPVVKVVYDMFTKKTPCLGNILPHVQDIHAPVI